MTTTLPSPSYAVAHQNNKNKATAALSSPSSLRLLALQKKKKAVLLSSPSSKKIVVLQRSKEGNATVAFLRYNTTNQQEEGDD
jgi:hypothetical protein